MMKLMNWKPLAALGLSLSLLVGSAVPGFAAENTADKTTCTEHEWITLEEQKTNCVDVDYTIRDAEGKPTTVTLCPTCGNVGGKENSKACLTKVDYCFSNFANLYVYKGTLDNGMEVMTVAYYTPERIETTLCKKCGTVKQVRHTDDSMPETPLNATFDLPVDAVKGYTLMRVNADGTETPVEVSLGERRAYFTLTVDSGACLIHLVPNEG